MCSQKIKYDSNKNKERIKNKIWDGKKKGGGVGGLVFITSFQSKETQSCQVKSYPQVSNSCCKFSSFTWFVAQKKKKKKKIDLGLP